MQAETTSPSDREVSKLVPRKRGPVSRAQALLATEAEGAALIDLLLTEIKNLQAEKADLELLRDGMLSLLRNVNPYAKRR